MVATNVAQRNAAGEQAESRIDERERKRSRGDREGDDDLLSGSARHDRRRRDASPSPGRNRSTASAPKTDEGKGEVSMSIEETNRVRLSLGLKPLAVNKSAAEERALAAAAVAERAEAAKKAKDAELAERVRSQKERRLEQEKLRKVKTLGEAGTDVDDLAGWVERSRKAEARAKEEERAKAAKLSRQLEEQDEAEESEDEDAPLQNARELAGMRVNHGTGELGEGETMILTLADRSLLDAQGDLDEGVEELENALVTEDKLRKKAMKAATKENKPLFGEDGRRRGLLDKYDEEEAEEGMHIDETGAVEAEKRSKQDEIRARLKAAESAATSNSASFNGKSDFYTKEEMEQFQKPKTKKKRKLRKKGDEGVDMAALEAEAAAADEGKDRGSRAQRATKDAAQAAAREAEQKDRQDRYDNALSKASLASLALQRRGDEEAGAADGEEEADDDLQQSLARARRAVLQKTEAEQRTAESVAADAIRRREERERREREMGGGLEFSEAKDFANSIQLVKVEEPAAEAKPDTEMAEATEEAAAAPTPLPPPPPSSQTGQKASAAGGWVAADKVKEESMDVELPRPPPVKKEEQPESLVREKNVGSGLAGAMALLRERGELQQKVEWAGRTNDMKKEKLQGLDDVYQGGRHEEKLAADIEQALTEKDEFGRVLTPKERFRRLCHNFHGKTISKTKQEKRLRKLQEEVDARRAATAEGTAAAFARVAGQQMAGTPYMVLSGKLQPGQSSDPASGFASVERQVAATPVPGGAMPRLGGGVTPLVGDHKVEVMLGLQRGKPPSKMAPPPPVNVRK